MFSRDQEHSVGVKELVMRLTVRSGSIVLLTLAPLLLGCGLLLVLKPARPGASYESLQVVTRVEGPPSR